jgi:NAD(P)-dependent dehydrogenase (short-subunit alcohol dehydrogenase family)
MSGLCEGRVAIVTGGGRGIGREYCLKLAAEGARVVVNDLGSSPSGQGQDAGPAQSVVSEIEAAGGEATVNFADVSNWQGAKDMIDQALSAYGRLDILINNAGMLRDRVLVNMTEADWDDVIRVHLKGTFAPSHHAAQHWREVSKKANGPVNGRLINVSSGSGIYGAPGQTNYGAAKAGIAAFTIIASRELERYGVTVNAIAPAAVTRLTDSFMTDELRRSLGPEWIAPLVVWLASERSKGVSGRLFEVYGENIAVAEGWHRGPTAKGALDPSALDDVVSDLLKRSRPNADIFGQDAKA